MKNSGLVNKADFSKNTELVITKPGLESPDFQKSLPLFSWLALYLEA